jgi:hypothetical protein
MVQINLHSTASGHFEGVSQDPESGDIRAGMNLKPCCDFNGRSVEGGNLGQNGFQLTVRQSAGAVGVK